MTALWARLQNPEHAYEQSKDLNHDQDAAEHVRSGPPFQIDGNLGGPAAITEMLVQSTPTKSLSCLRCRLQWSSGSLKGVRVRGGGKVDIAWKGALTESECDPNVPKKYRISYGDHTVKVQIRP